MRYVTTRREVEKGENGVIIRVFRDMKLEVIDWVLILAISATFLLLAFAVGFYSGKAVVEPAEAMQTEAVTEVETYEEPTEDWYIESLPLTYNEQKDLYDAAEEFGVDYYTMLGLIERETEFRNISGDSGNASGYCQIWRKWWLNKMREIGAEDLNVAKDNFRTACAIIAELQDEYDSLAGALTAYNKGSYNGRVTEYATAVLKNAEKWRNGNV
jgi:hypothetical protein